MIGKLITADHRVYELPPLTAWSIRYTGGVPCDSFQVCCPYDGKLGEVLHLAAGFLAVERGQVRLRAIVDEYMTELGPDGVTLTVSGRGYAARLLDNESRPITYQGASLAQLIANHVTPYGVHCSTAAPVSTSEVYTVPVGCSQWKALEGFCRTFGGFLPRFRRDGLLEAAPDKGGRTLTLGSDAPLLSCTVREDHYGVLTEVLVIDKRSGTMRSVCNRDMMARGGQCRRVIYTPGQDTWDANRYTGEYQLRRSKENELVVTAVLPGSFLAFPGDRITLALPRLGMGRRTLRVAEAENRFTLSGGAVTTLTLKE